jgi:hypothetical protein
MWTFVRSRGFLAEALGFQDLYECKLVSTLK